MKLYVSPEAEDDLDDIEQYIGADDPVAAVTFVRLLTERFTQLTDNPGIGHKRDYLMAGLRSIVEGNYLIFYRQKQAVIEVIRVLHGARNIENIFHSINE